MNGSVPDERGLSPVIGIVLLIGLVLLLAVASAAIFLGLAEEPDKPPNVIGELEPGDVEPVHRLRHVGGDSLGGAGKTEIRGVADPEVLHDTELTAGNDVSVVPIVPLEEEIEIVWHGDGESYVILRLNPASHLDADPDEGCEWADTETNDGNDDVDVHGVVVNCAVETDGDVDVDDGVIIGDASSFHGEMDVVDGRVYGDVAVDQELDTDNGTVSGAIDAADDVHLDDSTVGSYVEAGGDVDVNGSTVQGPVSGAGASEITIQDASVVEGNVETGPGGDVDVDGASVQGRIDAGDDITVDDGSVSGGLESVANDGKIDVTNAAIGGTVEAGGDVDLDGSTVDGPVYAEGDVDLDGATVRGDVYVGDEFTCADSTIDGRGCEEYTPEDPSDY